MTKTTPKRLLKAPHHPFGPLDALFLYLAGALLLVLALAAVVPAIMGLTPYVVTSGSMEPTFSRGDLIYIQPITSLEELSKDDIITFQSGDGVLTHRVYSIDDSSASLRTKADASVYLDPASVTADMLLGKPVYRIPLVGYVTLFFHKGGNSA